MPLQKLSFGISIKSICENHDRLITQITHKRNILRDYLELDIDRNCAELGYYFDIYRTLPLPAEVF